MSNPLNISPSPHIHGKESTEKLMYGVVLALMPALFASIYFFGTGAIIVTATSVISCISFEYLIQRFILRKPLSINDGSAIVTGLLLALNLPSNIPVPVIIIGSLVAIGVAKMTFGGLGNNPFNPALAGRVFMLISFPVQMTSWPVPSGFKTGYIDAVTGATPLSIIKEGIKNGESLSQLMEKVPSTANMIFGNMGGSIGEVSALALIIGMIYMLYQKIITWHIPVSIIGSIAVFTALLWLINPESNADPMFHILAGGVLLGAIFMATDYVTSPMSPVAMLIYGCGIGILTVIIRVWGAYPEGVSFAILIMNAFVPLMNTYIKPKRFGEEVKNG
ncbi:MAG: Na+-transporting NADH:ubiquinone oxidoreductase subunit D [Bacteroidetes bacterium GWE2_41_25]|nr:MAG: Na+-transporting NADH:ubiquinone oxidoreductase subunit D [Bacteroidetes bacterium GWA2_40_15]OFX92740.1 MAG: Na+-transporting NADH:ubiquinone oxidoreductase subunit D [Bacteroidetes bacterium GWE2_41_25]OFX94858.1 MAG: Na+-transporting NADH:ubiquinone oxidoreductase subunit D [Bacteroidetes bacterium GWC2_40_22]OFY60167.1 MAG: Na+-transporting NADH:ubiquinone oxidoreductase subunit D [Bacteroidetes bacterium GWF2_41_9]HAM09032.1 Na+-transporting NADH:ubiquinone oxidoreductase subunit D